MNQAGLDYYICSDVLGSSAIIELVSVKFLCHSCENSLVTKGTKRYVFHHAIAAFLFLLQQESIV
jgi:hypothetical protein